MSAGNRGGTEQTDSREQSGGDKATSAAAPASEKPAKPQAAAPSIKRVTEEGSVTAVSGDMSELLGSASDRIKEVLQATDEAAKAILEQAKKDARAHKEEARRQAEQATRERTEKMTKVTDEVLQQAETLQRRARELAETLSRSHEALKEELGIQGPPTQAPRGAPAVQTPSGSPAPAVQPTSVVDRDQSSEDKEEDKGSSPLRRLGLKRKPRPQDSGVNEEARLRALQMLVAGTDRKVIAVRLKEEFAIEDPTAILDALVEVQPARR